MTMYVSILPWDFNLNPPLRHSRVADHIEDLLPPTLTTTALAFLASLALVLALLAHGFWRH